MRQKAHHGQKLVHWHQRQHFRGETQQIAENHRRFYLRLSDHGQYAVLWKLNPKEEKGITRAISIPLLIRPLCAESTVARKKGFSKDHFTKDPHQAQEHSNERPEKFITHGRGIIRFMPEESKWTRTAKAREPEGLTLLPCAWGLQPTFRAVRRWADKKPFCGWERSHRVLWHKL